MLDQIKHKASEQKQTTAEIRKIQAIHGNQTYVLVVPREFISNMKIAKGDYVKCSIHGEQLVVEKADL
jgi:hypothetical protein